MDIDALAAAKKPTCRRVTFRRHRPVCVFSNDHRFTAVLELRTLFCHDRCWIGDNCALSTAGNETAEYQEYRWFINARLLLAVQRHMDVIFMWINRSCGASSPSANHVSDDTLYWSINCISIVWFWCLFWTLIFVSDSIYMEAFYSILLTMLSLSSQTFSQDLRSVVLTKLDGQQFQCANSTCPPFSTATVPTVLACQISCLSFPQCRSLSFRAISNTCALFFHTFNSAGNMLTNTEIITFVAIDNTRAPSGQ